MASQRGKIAMKFNPVLKESHKSFAELFMVFQ